MPTPEERKFSELDKKIMALAEQVKATRTLAYSTDDKVSKIFDILKGDEFGGYSGIVKQVEENKQKIKSLESLKDRATYIVIGLALPSGYGFITLLKAIFGTE